MPKNKGKGGKNRRREKTIIKKELILKEPGQEYAQVIKMLGNSRLEALCFDNQKRLCCHIRGKLRKRVWILAHDIILISLRDFQDNKADVILKYSLDDARQLKNKGEIPENVNITETAQDDIVFDEQQSETSSSEDHENVNMPDSTEEDD